MATLAVAESLDELKSLYRRYAAIHHPDKGGCTLRMQNLNFQYKEMKHRLKKSANDEVITADDFSRLQVGDHLYVNTTRVEVLEVSRMFFRVVAVGRSRQALFDKRTGLTRNPRLRASFNPIIKPSYYH